MARRRGKEPEPLPQEEQIFEIRKDTKLIVKIRDNASPNEVRELADNIKRLRDGEIHTLIIPMSYKLYKLVTEPEEKCDHHCPLDENNCCSKCGQKFISGGPFEEKKK